jgi:biotin-[acetyl-CoA-carboxylase] ligase BirA-like protein
MASFDSPNANMTPFDSSKDIYWFHEVDSTMDKARELLKNEEYSRKKSFAVVGDYQTAGRGTRGRTWVSAVGNMYMTLVINMADVPLALTLTPIRVGTFIIKAIDNVLRASPAPPPLVQLKWPNDVIINGEKVSGVLIEIEDGKMLIGIGCNIVTAPVAPADGPDSGCRAATHLSAFTGTAEETHKMILQLRNVLANDVYDSAQQWVSGTSGDTAAAAIDDFHLRMDDSWQVRTLMDDYAMVCVWCVL